MTGIARKDVILPTKNKLTIEIRSSNHKYLELTQKLPQTLTSYENDIRDLIREKIRRGNLFLAISWEESKTEPRLTVNQGLLKSYLKIAKNLREKYKIPGNLDINTVLNFPGMITTEKRESVSADFLDWKNLKGAINQTIKELERMKICEGRNLARDFRMRLRKILRILNVVKHRTVLRKKKRRELQLLNKDSVKPNLTEPSDKLDITEELVRLRSHCHMFRQALMEPGASGKKLDFILVEMLREADTMAAKARDLLISQKAIEIKEEIEKLKEQVRNVE